MDEILISVLRFLERIWGDAAWQHGSWQFVNAWWQRAMYTKDSF